MGSPVLRIGQDGHMRLTVVGCAGSFPSPDSPASCYLLEADGFRLVIDFGNGSLGALQKYIPLFGVDAVCLSHLHADHCVDLYSYSIARAYSPAGPQPSIPVYGPAGTAERIARAPKLKLAVTAGIGSDHVDLFAHRWHRELANLPPATVRNGRKHRGASGQPCRARRQSCRAVGGGRSPGPRGRPIPAI